MAAEGLKPQHLRPLLERVLLKEPNARVVGVQATGPWLGKPSLEVRGKTFKVVQALTPLAVREVLQRIDGQEGERTAILIACPPEELGKDVKARLYRNRPFSIQWWDTAERYFQATKIVLRKPDKEKALIDALIECAPQEGYSAAPAGILDSDTLWRAYFSRVLGLAGSKAEDADLDLAALLIWGSTEEGLRKYLDLLERKELHDLVRERVREVLGEAGESVIHFLGSTKKCEALPLALACGVLFAEEPASKEAQAARVRLERFHAQRPMTARAARSLGEAAVMALRELETRGKKDDARRLRARTDEVLRELGAEGIFHHSASTPAGLEARLRRFGEALARAVESPAELLEECETLAGKADEHDLVRERSPVRDRLEMALRLLRWLAGAEDPEPASFAEAARRYLEDGAFVDRAREAVSGGEEMPAVAEGYRRLDGAVSARRREENRRFAELLRGWAESGSSAQELLLVEDVIPRVLLPLLEAKQNVLLIVIDGMSWAVALEVLHDDRVAHSTQTACVKDSRRPGTAASRDGRPGPLPVIASMPCVTEHSRASLFAGEPASGAQADEKRSFASHAGLLAACGKKHPPVVFHKAEVTPESRGPPSEEVLEAIRSRERKVVGVVINAVDERLANAQQKRDDWSLDAIRPLAAILQAAWEGGRVVVLASDHGHVLHRQGENAAFEGAGERWRPAEGRPREGEVLVRGPRVRGPGGAEELILAWEEGLRYGAYKNGYHGGATPQEMVAPLVVLAHRDRVPAVLEPRDLPLPDWWSGTRAGAEPPPAGQGAAPARIQEEFADLPIFSRAPLTTSTKSPARASWLEDLFACEAYQAQREMVRRHAPPDEQVRRALEVLAEQGGAITPAALAQKLDLLLARLDGFLAKVQRLINIDGYEVLLHDRSRNVVELNVELLRKQFNLE